MAPEQNTPSSEDLEQSETSAVEHKGQKQRPGGRKRGAQPGNKNALKHGFYAGNFSSTELTDLEVSLAKGLGDEIALLRVLIRCFACDLEAKDALDPSESAGHLAIISDAMVRLGSLLRTDRLLAGAEDSAVMKTITAAIGTFTEDLGPYNL